MGGLALGDQPDGQQQLHQANHPRRPWPLQPQSPRGSFAFAALTAGGLSRPGIRVRYTQGRHTSAHEAAPGPADLAPTTLPHTLSLSRRRGLPSFRTSMLRGLLRRSPCWSLCRPRWHRSATSRRPCVPGCSPSVRCKSACCTVPRSAACLVFEGELHPRHHACSGGGAPTPMGEICAAPPTHTLSCTRCKHPGSSSAIGRSPIPRTRSRAAIFQPHLRLQHVSIGYSTYPWKARGMSSLLVSPGGAARSLQGRVGGPCLPPITRRGASL
jgi:hypothetical protein